jgi:starch phosphorylase
VGAGPTENLPYGSTLQVTADLFLDALNNEDVVVEIFYGDVDPSGNIPKGKTVTMRFMESLGNNVYRFTGAISCEKTGQQGFSVRVIPSHKDLGHKHETGLIVWA